MSSEANEARGSIERLLGQFEKAHNASDVEGMLGCWGKDPVYTPQNSPAMTGREAVRRYQEQAYRNFRFDEHYRIDEIEVSGDVAWARGYSFGRVKILASGQEIDFGGPHRFPGANTLWIFHREDGHWRIHRYTFGADRPMAPGT